MATLVSFRSFFGDRMADLGLIDSKLGLYIKVNVNKRQNKFEVHISKNVAKMAILWPKIGQRHFGARASHGHNLAIFHQMLTNEHTKMTSLKCSVEAKTRLFKSSFFFRTHILWNNLPTELKQQNDSASFQTSLKHLLLDVLLDPN